MNKISDMETSHTKDGYKAHFMVSHMQSLLMNTGFIVYTPTLVLSIQT